VETDVTNAHVWRWSTAAARTGLGLGLSLCLAVAADARALKDVQVPATPLILQGARRLLRRRRRGGTEPGQLGGLGPGGRIVVTQKYVRFMVPASGDRNVPVVSQRLASQSSKTGSRPELG
jgi:hypothetical protein